MRLEIIIPAYNCRRTLDRTLSSLGAQTDNDFSVHIIDDCSTESYNDIIDRHKNLNIRVTRNSTNMGCGMSRQVGIDMTDADYIAFLDSDDMLMPYTVETWKCAVNASSEVDMFHSHFFEQKHSSGVSNIRLLKNGFPWCHGKLYKVSFIRHWNIRNLPEIKCSDDNYFNSICAELGNIAAIPIPMYLWADNPDSITRKSDGSFNREAAGDFVHAMRLVVKFIKSKGINKFKYMDNTINNIRMIIDTVDSDVKHEFHLLLNEINGR